MAVFDDLNPPTRRIEDPEARQAEKIVREGKGVDVRRHSSGVKVTTYQRSLTVLNVFIGFGTVVVILGLVAVGVFLYTNG